VPGHARGSTAFYGGLYLRGLSVRLSHPVQQLAHLGHPAPQPVDGGRGPVVLLPRRVPGPPRLGALLAGLIEGTLGGIETIARGVESPPRPASRPPGPRAARPRPRPACAAARPTGVSPRGGPAPRTPQAIIAAWRHQQRRLARPAPPAAVVVLPAPFGPGNPVTRLGRRLPRPLRAGEDHHITWPSETTPHSWHVPAKCPSAPSLGGGSRWCGFRQPGRMQNNDPAANTHRSWTWWHSGQATGNSDRSCCPAASPMPHGSSRPGASRRHAG
jgi:hypothetical protein